MFFERATVFYIKSHPRGSFEPVCVKEKSQHPFAVFKNAKSKSYKQSRSRGSNCLKKGRVRF